MYSLRATASRLSVIKQLLRHPASKTSFLTPINSYSTTRRFLTSTTTTFHTTKSYNNLRTLHTTTIKMSNPGTNTTGSGAPAVDPYKSKNTEDDISLQEKVEALVKFAQANKFGMMTTRDAETGMLVSRCMAIAASVSNSVQRVKAGEGCVVVWLWGCFQGVVEHIAALYVSRWFGSVFITSPLLSPPLTQPVISMLTANRKTAA